MEARELEILEGNLDPSLRQQLYNKWNKFVETIPNRRVAENTAMLLENQMSHMKRMITEANTTVNVAEYTKFIFPLIKAVWPNLIANAICSVQPMDQPIGAIATKKNLYGTTKGTIVAGTEFPSLTNFDPTYSQADTLVTEEAVGTGDGTSKVFFKKLLHPKVNPGTLTITAGSVHAVDDGNGGLSGTGVAGGVVNYETGLVTVSFSAAPAGAAPVTADYSYMIEGTSEGISSIESDMDIIPVRARSRKLVSLYSIEFAEDMKAIWGADAEADLVSSSASEVALEVDREIVNMAKAVVPAAHTLEWDATYAQASTQLTYQDFLRTLLHKIGQAAQKIYKATLKNPGNWIITSPEVVAMLDQLPEFTPIVANQEYQIGVQKAGVLVGKYTVFSDPFMPYDEIFIGYKGPGWADAGIAYAPYIPVQLTPTFFNPTSFQMSKGIRTRYALKVLNPVYFAKVKIKNFNKVFEVATNS